MPDNDYKRPSLHQHPTGERLEDLKRDITNLYKQAGRDDGRFIGPRGGVSEDRIIDEGLKILRQRFENGELDIK